MSEIPDDIMKTAGKLVDLTIRNYEKEVFANVSRDHVAAAILAERQRCADVVAHYCDSDEYSTNYRLIAADMAEAILRPQP